MRPHERPFSQMASILYIDDCPVPCVRLQCRASIMQNLVLTRSLVLSYPNLSRMSIFPSPPPPHFPPNLSNHNGIKNRPITERFFGDPTEVRTRVVYCPKRSEGATAEFTAGAESSTRLGQSKSRSKDLLFGDPTEVRTRVTAVKGRCLNHLTMGPRVFVPNHTNYISAARGHTLFSLVAAVRFEPTTCRV